MNSVFTSLAPKRTITFEDQMEIEGVLDAAHDWKKGLLPLGQAANIGTIENHDGPSAPYTRYVATINTPKDDPRWGHLQELCTVLAKMSGWSVTRQGVYSSRDVAETRALAAQFSTWSEHDG